MVTKMDLTKVFEPVVKIVPQSEPVHTLVSDVFGTLVSSDSKKLNQPLHHFLLWVKDSGFTVYLASSDPDTAQEALRRAGCHAALLEDGVYDKSKIMNRLMDDGTAHIAVDDSTMIWFDAIIVLSPDDRKFGPYLEKAGYIHTLRLAQ